MADDQSYEGSYEPRLSAHKSDVVLEVRQVRKRIWTHAEKLQIVREGLQPDAQPSEIMRRHGISSSLFYTWRKKFLDAAPPGFMPVRIAAPAPASSTASSLPQKLEASGVPAIEIKTPDGIVVRIDNAVDAKTLSAVLKAVCG
jgi:transposase